MVNVACEAKCSSVLFRTHVIPHAFGGKTHNVLIGEHTIFKNDSVTEGLDVAHFRPNLVLYSIGAGWLFSGILSCNFESS